MLLELDKNRIPGPSRYLDSIDEKGLNLAPIDCIDIYRVLVYGENESRRASHANNIPADIPSIR